MPTPEFDLSQALPDVIPLAVNWAKEHEAIIDRTGLQLNPVLVRIARTVGVQHPELVRIRFVSQIPEPIDPTLYAMAREVQLITPNSAGITFNYGVYIRQDCANDLRLHAHELAHVGQYERFGGILPFIRQYCQQLVAFGYHDAPMEVEARKAEELPKWWDDNQTG